METSMFREPWEKKVWIFVGVMEIYLVGSLLIGT